MKMSGLSQILLETAWCYWLEIERLKFAMYLLLIWASSSGKALSGIWLIVFFKNTFFFFQANLLKKAPFSNVPGNLAFSFNHYSLNNKHLQHEIKDEHYESTTYCIFLKMHSLIGHGSFPGYRRSWVEEKDRQSKFLVEAFFPLPLRLPFLNIKYAQELSESVLCSHIFHYCNKTCRYDKDFFILNLLETAHWITFEILIALIHELQITQLHL